MKRDRILRPPRGRRGSAALLASVLIIAAAALSAVAAVQIYRGHDATVLGHIHVAARWLRRTHWSSAVVLTAGVISATLGLLAVLAALTPARRKLVPFTEDHPHAAAGITRRGLRRELRAAAAGVDGVSAARVQIIRDRVRVRALSALRDRTGLDTEIETAVAHRLEPLPLHRVQVRVRAKED